MSTCHNNPKTSLTTKINKHKASGYSLLTYCPFDTTKNKLDYYRKKIIYEKFLSGFKRTCEKIVDQIG